MRYEPFRSSPTARPFFFLIGLPQAKVVRADAFIFLVTVNELAELLTLIECGQLA